MRKKILLLILFTSAVLPGLFVFKATAQPIMITGKSFNTYNAGIEAMLSIGMVNAGAERTVELECRLLDSDGQILIQVRSFPFLLKNGSYSGMELGIREKDVQYGATEKSLFIRNRKVLPSGSYNLCYTILDQYGETSVDEYCDEISSEYNSELLLVSPFDGSEIETKYPVLVWFHSEPFELLNTSESYRIIVSEIKTDQSPEQAIAEGKTVFMQDHLLIHQVPYPVNALPLEDGKKYAWVVQKISRGVVVQRTETWTFYIRENKTYPDIKYMTLSKTLDAGFYKVTNNHLFFRLDEDYDMGELKYFILDEANHAVAVQPGNEKSEGGKKNLAYHGYNRYQLDLSPYDLKPNVIYTLKAVTRKNEVYLLKFQNY